MLRTTEQRMARQESMRRKEEAVSADVFRERHYKIKELAELWNFGVETVRRQVMREPDVVKIVGPNGRTTYSVPESVARRIHTKLTAPKRPSLVTSRA